jgi:SH3-like domain-containing protein
MRMKVKSQLKYCKIIVQFLCLALINVSNASNVEFQPGKFYYIRSSEVNLRAGPDKRYPIRWVIKSRGEPVIAIVEFDNWVKIKDIDGDGGWLHSSMLSSAKHGILLGAKNFELLRSGPSDISRPIARLGSGIRLSVKKCLVNDWCAVSLDGLKGWVHKKSMWGVN